MEVKEKKRTKEQLDAQRQYVVIGSLALLMILFCLFLGSGPEGGDVL